MNQSNITKVYLLDVPLEPDYKNTLYFANASAQQAYFQSRIVKSYTDFSYQRKDRIIRIPDIVDNIYHCNYVMYQNSNYSNKWFYAFIDKMEYINDGRTDVTISTDVMQTWAFDFTIKPSFVEREHVDNDTFGLHTIPEGLETGEYVRQTKNNNSATDSTTWLNYLSQIYYVVATTGVPGWVIPQPPKIYNGVYSGLFYLVFPTATDLDRFINDIQSQTTDDIIYSIFVIPQNMVEIPESSWITPTGKNYRYQDYPYTSTFANISSGSLTKPEFLDADYVPRNNKLLCYPYTYLLAHNFSGSSKEYRFELFNSDDCKFQIEGAVGPGCSIKLYPKAYNIKSTDSPSLQPINYIEGLDAGKLPTCSWTSDSYQNWLRQNALNIPLSIIGSTGAIIGGAALAATGAGALAGTGAMAGGIAGIAGQLAQIYEHSLAPITAQGGANQGDLTFAQRNTFAIYKMSIRKEYAQVIDQYFDMFGYKVNTVKVPNKNHRQRWWYTKTIDVNIDGAIPDEDMQKIKDNYNKGITFWKNASEMDNYTLSNNIV